MVLSEELSPVSSLVVYLSLIIAFILLSLSLGYYWRYARSIERFLRRENRTNNMMRQDLVDSFLERGEQEWPCVICYYFNYPEKRECIMCGTPQIQLNTSDSQKIDIRSANHTMLDHVTRMRSLYVRRLNQMNLNVRQKAAIRRHLWKRKKGNDGRLYWVRSDAMEKENALNVKSVEDNHSQHSILDIDVHVAKALSHFEDCRDATEWDYRKRLNNSFTTVYGASELKDQHSQPSRLTAIKQLDQAKERLTSVNHHSNPYHSAPSLDKSIPKSLNCIEAKGIHETGRDNESALSTGFLRHDNGLGGFDWTPATIIQLPPFIQINTLSYDLEEIAALPFKQKNRWFLREIQKMWRASEYHIQFVIRRTHLIEDSMEQTLRCPKSRFWERLRIYFENEPGLDAGGLIREWYELLSDILFSDEFGLFTATKGDRSAYFINPHSPLKHHNHLLYYEFVGRLIGKAVIEGYNLKISLALPLIKHILGVPISFSDLEFLDIDLYRNINWLRKNRNVESLQLDFTVQVLNLEGKFQTLDLILNGTNIPVTDSNKSEYIALLLKHYMFSSISEQLTALLKGLYDIVPTYLLTVFDYQEFDLLLSGIPEIDVSDWQKHTEIRWIKMERPSLFEQQLLDWFWEVIKYHFSAEERARLLQFATGASRVPAQGFKALISSDGRVRRFTIQFVERGEPPTGLLIKGHTCFNRIDIPQYKDIEEMVKYLTLVINMEMCGFWLE